MKRKALYYSIFLGIGPFLEVKCLQQVKSLHFQIIPLKI